MAYNATQPCDDRPHRMGAHLDGLASPTPKQDVFPGVDQYWFWAKELDEPYFVYVIRGRFHPAIKIGKAKDPLARMAGLQTGNPDPLSLLYVIPGYGEEERSLHHRLRHEQVAGEWFDGPRTQEFIAWMAEFSAECIRQYESDGTLPEVTITKRRQPPSGLRTHTGQGKVKLSGGWRLTDNIEHRPRRYFVEPCPPDPDEIAERNRKETLKRDLARSARMYSGKWPKEPAFQPHKPST